MNQSWIKKIRIENNLTQLELSRLMGVDQSQVSRWEREVQPIPEWVDRLIECLFKKDS